MAYYFNSQDLINSVKRRANIPDSQAMITDEEILDFANEEMLLNLIPLIVSKHEDYFLIEEEVSTQSGQNAYPIPYRALGTKLRELAYKEADAYVPLHRVSIDTITDTYSRTTGYSSHRFYIMGENVVLNSPFQDVQYSTLAFFYDLRPNMLVLPERVSVITSIDRVTGQITVDKIPENITSGLKLDFIKLNAPHRILDYDKTPTSVDIANTIITFNPSDIPHEVAVGDHICLANETDLVNAPSELHVMLAQMVAARVLESIGDSQGLQNVNDKLAKMEKNADYLITNRVTGSPIKCTSRKNLLRSRRYGRRR